MASSLPEDTRISLLRSEGMFGWCIAKSNALADFRFAEKRSRYVCEFLGSSVRMIEMQKIVIAYSYYTYSSINRNT